LAKEDRNGNKKKRACKMKAVLVDFKRTLFDPEKNCLLPQALEFLQGLKEKKFKICFIGG